MSRSEREKRKRGEREREEERFLFRRPSLFSKPFFFFSSSVIAITFFFKLYFHLLRSSPTLLAGLLTRSRQDALRSNSSSVLLAPDRRGGGAKPPELPAFVDGCRWPDALLLFFFSTPIRRRCCRPFCCPPRLGLPGGSDRAGLLGAPRHGLCLLSRPGAHPRLQARALWAHHRRRRRRRPGAGRVGGEQLQGRLDLGRRRRVVRGDLGRARVRARWVDREEERGRERERERERGKTIQVFFLSKSRVFVLLSRRFFNLFKKNKKQKNSATLEYKLVALDGQGNPADWQLGENRIVEVTAAGGAGKISIAVEESWEGGEASAEVTVEKEEEEAEAAAPAAAPAPAPPKPSSPPTAAA